MGWRLPGVPQPDRVPAFGCRCGLAGYSLNSRFNYEEMYPTNLEKVQALLNTHMSLLDTKHYQHIIRTHALSSTSFDMKDLAALYTTEAVGGK
jgi:hypothetical protein